MSHCSRNILIKPGSVSFFQITLRTAGEGRTKSPERAQRMRHVHRKGLGAGNTGRTSWLETLKLNVPMHFGNQGLPVVPRKLLTLKLKLKLS